MPLLTTEMLESRTLFRYYSRIDYSNIRRAYDLIRHGYASVTEFTGETATCSIEDGVNSYVVALSAASDQVARLACTCQRAQQGYFCVHMAAAAQVVSTHIFEAARNHWRYRLQMGLDSTPQRTRSRASAPYVVLFGLHSIPYGRSLVWFLDQYRIDAGYFSAIDIDAPPLAPEAYGEILDQSSGWRYHAELVQLRLKPSGCLNLSESDAPVLSRLFNTQTYYRNEEWNFADFLPWLSQRGVPIFMAARGELLEQRLQIVDAPVTIEAALERSGDHLNLQAGFRLTEGMFSTLTTGLNVISVDPMWMKADHYLVQIANPEALAVMQLAPLTIPAADEDAFRSEYFLHLAERVPIRGDAVEWQEIEAEPVPRLYLSDAEDTLVATLRFGYAEHEVLCERHPPEVVQREGSEPWSFVRIQRDVDTETTTYQAIAKPTYGLKRATGRPYGTFALRARTHPYDFLARFIPELIEAGFEIYGEENLKVGRVNHNAPSLSLGISSGLDWFDLDAAVHYGDQQVSLGDMRSALRKGRRYIKLADGSIGQLPELWLKRYQRLFDMAEETADGHLRVADFHLPLLDPLLDDAADVRVDTDFEERKQRLRDFRSIEAQPMPAGFTGELRPYQRSGLDWLHFLHDYGLGGCLADDMGLGKTIQVLALLQLLKEEGLAQGLSLLVVPKSLLVNWQREAGRFTPELRFLEYIGNSRTKDPADFNAYDIIITTYGTMLRDIELLRTVRFDYAILDESQAIKNPGAKTSRAARLLDAAHRLVLTGTPVENNTFELWSQLAYLNPGLLGNLAYFKREFATPIEKHHDESAAQLLRQLIYPFILRRTKGQVAQELPPRTERVIYVDMVPAQHKVYQRTRDYYRQLLLGMIEEQGLEDTRMRVLEGLLRLRQASIHPKLLEPTYRGKAPKFEMLMETLETLRSEGHKVLIFSQFVAVLTFLRAQLDEAQIRYAYLDGKTRNRQAQVDEFQNDPQLPLFLISLRAGGVGLNLTAADYVIHLDPWWNPAVEQQASDRAHRIGQDRPVFIYKLITRDSVEEKILILQERKLQLVDQLISSESGFFKALTVEDVTALFS